MAKPATPPHQRRTTAPPARPARKRQTGWRYTPDVIAAVRALAETEGMPESEVANTLLARAIRRPRSDMRGEREVPGMRDESIEFLLARRVKVEDMADAGGYTDARITRYLNAKYGDVAAERILLRRVRGYSFDEIAARTGKSKQAVEQHLSRLEPKLRADANFAKLLRSIVTKNTRGEVPDDE